MIPPRTAVCWLAQFSEAPCEGVPPFNMCKAHLVDKQVLKRKGHDPWDDRAWRWSCGGPWPHLAGHHGMLDNRKLCIPRHRLSPELEELCEQLNLSGWLDLRYGLRREVGLPAKRGVDPQPPLERSLTPREHDA